MDYFGIPLQHDGKLFITKASYSNRIVITIQISTYLTPFGLRLSFGTHGVV